MAEFDRDDVRCTETKDVFQGFFRIRELSLQHRLFAGGWSKTLSRELFVRGDATGILLFDPALQKIALVEQFRIGAYASGRQPWLLELVAGMLDKNYSAEQIAVMEAKEEANCEVKRIEPICNYYVSPGGTSEYFYLFCGEADLSQAGGVYGLESEGEDIKVHCFDLSEVPQLLDSGKVDNAQTIIALQWLLLNQDRLIEQWT